MKILFVAGVPSQPPIGGAALAILRLGQKLREQGHEVDYLFAEGFPSQLVREPVSTFALPLALPIRLRRLPGYDVLDITSGDGVVYLGLQRLGLMHKFRATVMRSHGSEHEFGEILRAAQAHGVTKMSMRFRARFYGVRLAQVEKSLKWCDRVICCTRREADYVAKRLGIDRDKFSVVPHGVSEEFSNLDGNKHGKKNQIIFVGTWVWRKGTHLLVPVLSVLHARHPELRFILAGTQATTDSVRASLPREILEAVEVVPSLRPEQMARAVAESLFLLFPSMFEGFGLVPLEAMAAGTPVVMTKTVALTEWMNGDAPALLAPPEASEFIEASEKLLADESLRKDLAQRGKQWAHGFTWEQAARDTARVYEDALAARRRRA